MEMYNRKEFTNNILEECTYNNKEQKSYSIKSTNRNMYRVEIDTYLGRMADGAMK